MIGHAEQCVERYCELSGKKVDSLKKVATPCMDDHLMPPEDFVTKGAQFASRGENRPQGLAYGAYYYSLMLLL